MLTTRLEETWKQVTPEDQASAKRMAATILSNMVHYPMEKKRYYTDDVERLAAELVWFRMKEVQS